MLQNNDIFQLTSLIGDAKIFLESMLQIRILSRSRIRSCTLPQGFMT